MIMNPGFLFTYTPSACTTNRHLSAKDGCGTNFTVESGSAPAAQLISFSPDVRTRSPVKTVIVAPAWNRAGTLLVDDAVGNGPFFAEMSIAASSMSTGGQNSCVFGTKVPYTLNVEPPFFLATP